jgi:hypothetical protein
MNLAKEIEGMLRGAGVPYIVVEEAKKALFGGQKLASFDFVIYCRDMPNWLMCCGERRKEKVADMRQWRDIFGDGFKVIFAVRRAAGIRYMDIEGASIELVTGKVAPSSLVVVESSGQARGGSNHRRPQTTGAALLTPFDPFSISGSSL